MPLTSSWLNELKVSPGKTAHLKNLGLHATDLAHLQKLLDLFSCCQWRAFFYVLPQPNQGISAKMYRNIVISFVRIKVPMTHSACKILG